MIADLPAQARDAAGRGGALSSPFDEALLKRDLAVFERKPLHDGDVVRTGTPDHEHIEFPAGLPFTAGRIPPASSGYWSLVQQILYILYL